MHTQIKHLIYFGTSLKIQLKMHMLIVYTKSFKVNLV